jgi:RNA polymerase sigma-70 factor (sigma-E family)
LAEGGDGGFESFVGASGARLLKLAYLLTGNAPDADELVQESLTRLFVAWSQAERADSIDAYVRQIMVNTNRRRFRRRRVAEVLDGRIHERSGGQGDFAVFEDRRHLAPALASLPRRQRSVIVLRYYEDLSEGDVAALLGCTVGTVKSQASKAIAKLRNHPSLKTAPDPQPDGVPNA